MEEGYCCPICGRKLIKSEIEGYSFQCLHCDEDFTEAEITITIKAEEAMKKKDNRQQEEMEFLYGKKNVNKPMYQTVHETHNETVRECGHCGRPLTRSDMNDYGTLCETCYMKEYYG